MFRSVLLVAVALASTLCAAPSSMDSAFPVLRPKSTVILIGDSITDGWRIAGQPLWDQHFAQLPWFARNLFIKVLMTLRLDPVVRLITRRPAEWPY